jgi:recombination protein RecR
MKVGAVIVANERLPLCSVCFNVSLLDPCAICASVERERQRICVAQTPSDLEALNRSADGNYMEDVLI